MTGGQDIDVMIVLIALRIYIYPLSKIEFTTT